MSARLQKSFCAPCPFTEVCRRSDLPTFLFLKSFRKTNRTLRALSSHADLLLHNTAPKIWTQWYINFTFHLWRLLQLLIGTVDVKKNGSEFLCLCVRVWMCYYVCAEQRAKRRIVSSIQYVFPPQGPLTMNNGQCCLFLLTWGLGLQWVSARPSQYLFSRNRVPAQRHIIRSFL